MVLIDGEQKPSVQTLYGDGEVYGRVQIDLSAAALASRRYS
jgi:hypothetical protein